MGENKFGIDPKMLKHYAEQIKAIRDLGTEVAIVIGGGNIFRGLQAADSGIERVQGDYMGMLATVINAMALQSSLESTGVYTPVILKKGVLLFSLPVQEVHILQLTLLPHFVPMK